MNNQKKIMAALAVILAAFSMRDAKDLIQKYPRTGGAIIAMLMAVCAAALCHAFGLIDIFRLFNLT